MKMQPIALSLIALTLAACNVQRKDEKIVAEFDTAKAKAEAREAGREIKAGAQQAGQEIKEGAQQAGAAINAGKQELDIRTALALDESVDRSNITITSDETAHSIRMTGSVPTLEQKARVNAIAREKAEGWTIVDELIILPAAPPASGTAPLISPTPVTVPTLGSTAPAPASAP